MKESRFSTVYGLKNSVDKLFKSIGNIATEPFTVEFQQKDKNHQLNYSPPDGIIVSENLFRQYDCLEYRCSRCCWKTRHWNIFTQEQYNKLPQVHKGFGQKIFLTINKNNRLFYVEDNTDEICRHLENNSCGIHEENPLHCALPLIKFKRTKRGDSEITYVTKEVYTRNWHMLCPVKFKTINKEGYQKTLWVLGKVKDLAEELQITTSIDKIILAVENHKKTNSNF